MSATRFDDEEEDAPSEREEAALAAAWEAMELGDCEAALGILREVDPRWPDRWIAEATACTEVGDLARARTLVNRARDEADLADHPDTLWAHGQLCLREWDLPGARTAFGRLVEMERSAGALERLSLCLEFDGDFASADALLEEAAGLDPEFTAPPRVSAERFARVIEEAIETLPPEVRPPLETTEIVVEPVPSEWMIDKADCSETPPDMLGLFTGTSQLDRTGDGVELPSRIYLFQRNLERVTRDEQELLTEIRITLFHEIGHMLGFDEEGVAGMGLE